VDLITWVNVEDIWSGKKTHPLCVFFEAASSTDMGVGCWVMAPCCGEVFNLAATCHNNAKVLPFSIHQSYLPLTTFHHPTRILVCTQNWQV
jgi:hypothetical protein